MRFAIFSGLPKSLGWFVATGLLFLLQLFPYTGMFLMLLAAPYWSVILLNIGFILLALEAALGRASLVWLVAPMLWFGGYGLAAWQSQHEAKQFLEEMAAFNAGKSLPADLRAQDIVLAENVNEVHPGTLVEQFDTPVVYQANRNFKTSRHLATRLAEGPICSAIQTDQRYRAAFIYTTSVLRNTPARGSNMRQQAPAICQIRAPQDPEKPAIMIETRQEQRQGALFRASVTHISIKDSQGHAIPLVHGTGSILSGWPKLAMGCALNSAKPSWVCDAGFLRDRFPASDEGDNASILVANALGLTPASATNPDRIASLPDPGLQKIIAAREDTSLDTLDQAIADPAVRVTVHDLAGLTQNPALLVSRTDKLVSAFRTRISLPRPIAEDVKNFGALIAALPAAEFSRIAPDILAILAASKEVSINNVSDALAFRLSGLGAVALPVLERFAFERPVLWAAAPIISLCRIGAPAAHHAEAIAQKYLAAKRTSDAHAAAFIALYRFGRADLALLDPDKDSSYRRRDYDFWSQTITPASPPDDCHPARTARR